MFIIGKEIGPRVFAGERQTPVEDNVLIRPVRVPVQPGNVTPVSPWKEVPLRGIGLCSQLNGGGACRRAVVEEDLADPVCIPLRVDKLPLIEMRLTEIPGVDHPHGRPVVEVEFWGDGIIGIPIPITINI